MRGEGLRVQRSWAGSPRKAPGAALGILDGKISHSSALEQAFFWSSALGSCEYSAVGSCEFSMFRRQFS